MAGTHTHLMRLLVQLETALVAYTSGKHLPEVMRPGEGLTFPPGRPVAGGLTANFLRMGRVGWYLWALLYGTAAELAQARAWLIESLELERKTGHMAFGARNEQLAADPHYGMHLYPMLLLWWVRHVSSAVAGLTHAWLREHFALLAAVAAPDGRVAYPGTRFKVPGAGAKGKHVRPIESCFEVATICHRELRGIPHQGNARKPSWGGWHDDDYFAAARMLRRLLADVGWCVNDQPALWPRLALPMTVDRHAGGHVAQLERTAAARGHLRNEIVSSIHFHYASGEIGYTLAWRDSPQATTAQPFGPRETRREIGRHRQQEPAAAHAALEEVPR